MTDTPTSLVSGPSVTVVIPVYNSAATLARALQSVFAQSLRPAAVIIVDDGSSDDPAAVVRLFGDAVTFCTQANAGAAAARNRGVSLATTELIAFLDADDYWHPRKLELQTQAFATNPTLTVCCTAYRTRSESQPDVGWPLLASSQVRLLQDFATLFASPYLATPTVMLRREAFLAVGGFRNHLTTAEDVDLWLRLGWRGAVGCIDSTLVTVVSTAGSATARRREGVFRDNLQVIADFIADHPEFASSRSDCVQRARARVYEDWGSGALSANDRPTARRHLWASLRARFTLRPALLLLKAVLPAGLRRR